MRYIHYLFTMLDMRQLPTDPSKTEIFSRRCAQHDVEKLAGICDGGMMLSFGAMVEANDAGVENALAR
jgi:hypothetical protein